MPIPVGFFTLLGVGIVVAAATMFFTYQSYNYEHHNTNSDSHYNWNHQSSSNNSQRRRTKRRNMCTICLEDILSELLELRCGHVFHTSCISVWLNKSRTCPDCRNPV